MIRSLAGKTPVIHPDAFVSEFAYVVGDVEIGEGSSVWPGCVIRGESKIVIGRFTCIQDNSTIHAERFRGNAEHYAELAAQFKAEGL